MEEILQAAIERVSEYEQIFDALTAAMQANQAIDAQDLQKLTVYYESDQWRTDYALDEMGLFPQELKRGVLSQDGVYDLLQTIWENQKTEGH